MISSNTLSYPMLRVMLSLAASGAASRQGWPIEIWRVLTAFLRARVYGDRDTDLRGQYICTPPYVFQDLKPDHKRDHSRKAY